MLFLIRSYGDVMHNKRGSLLISSGFPIIMSILIRNAPQRRFDVRWAVGG